MNKSTTIIHISFFILLISCDYSDSDNRLHPSVETLGVSTTSDQEFHFEGRITKHSNLKVIDHGFIWNLNEKVTEGLYDQISLGPLNDESFNAKANYGFNANLDYYVRAYAKTTREIVYGNPFIIRPKDGLTPYVEGFNPKTGVPGDTITIFGKNLSANNAISDIRTDNFEKMPIINGSNSSLQVHAINSGNLNFSSFLYHWTSSDPFTLLLPNYSDHYPKVGGACDIITIVGENFGNGVDFNQISIDGESANLLSATKNKIEFYVPLLPSEGNKAISHKIGPKLNRYQFYYDLSPYISFSGLSSTRVSVGDIITINGSNIPVCDENKIEVFFVDAGISTTLKKISTSENQITVQIPQVKRKGNFSLFVKVFHNQYLFNFEIE
jgi:hypothetical protein